MALLHVCVHSTEVLSLVYVAQPREPRVLMALLHVVVTCEDQGFISR